MGDGPTASPTQPSPIPPLNGQMLIYKKQSQRSKQEIKAIQFAIAISPHTPCRSCSPMIQTRTNTSPHSLLRRVKAKKPKKRGETNMDILAGKIGD